MRDAKGREDGGVASAAQILGEDFQDGACHAALKGGWGVWDPLAGCKKKQFELAGPCAQGVLDLPTRPSFNRSLIARWGRPWGSLE